MANYIKLMSVPPFVSRTMCAPCFSAFLPLLSSACLHPRFSPRRRSKFFADLSSIPSTMNMQQNKHVNLPSLGCNGNPIASTSIKSPPPTSVYRRRLPEQLVDLTSAEGKRRFTAALAQGNAEAFFPLVSQFQTQSHPAICGLTTLSTVLNALAIDPKRVWAHPWRWFAESLLDCCLDLENIKQTGITLDQLACTADCQGCDVTTHRNISVNDARKLIRDSVRGTGTEQFEFVIASYDRQSLGQTGTGHFSPIAAFDDESDSVLVLDVARFKYGPHWIPITDLAQATRPIDPSTGLSRGFLLIRKKSEEAHVTKNIELYQSMDCRNKILKA